MCSLMVCNDNRVQTEICLKNWKSHSKNLKIFTVMANFCFRFISLTYSRKFVIFKLNHILRSGLFRNYQISQIKWILFNRLLLSIFKPKNSLFKCWMFLKPAHHCAGYFDCINFYLNQMRFSRSWVVLHYLLTRLNLVYNINY